MNFDSTGLCLWCACVMWCLLCVSCTGNHENIPEQEWTQARVEMVDQLRVYRIRDETILKAMGKVRRHMFIPEQYRRQPSVSYGDHPCPIGHDQTISQPFIVAYMTECLGLKAGERVLEIGTGSGYQAAVLAELNAQVYTVELIPQLADHARTVLKSEGYEKVHVLTGDGYKGWPEYSPFDAIIVTCAPDEVPQALADQLNEGGRMIIPIGSGVQRLVILRKRNGKITRDDDIFVRFVPMVHGKEVSTNTARQNK